MKYTTKIIVQGNEWGNCGNYFKNSIDFECKYDKEEIAKRLNMAVIKELEKIESE